jgi:nitrite reductase (NADH) small subunit
MTLLDGRFGPTPSIRSAPNCISVITERTGTHLVCDLDRLVPDRGVAALIDGRPIAVFLLSDGSMYAIDNIDPFSGASVMSRGIVGDADGAATVASPMYKQRFDLGTGRCLDEPDVTIAVFDVVEDGGAVYVRLGG